MRFSVNAVANAIAWVVIAVLIGAAMVVAEIFGAVGLMLLGGMTALVCARAEMDQDVPTWGVAVFKARMSGDKATPEQHAAMASERQALVSPLRFYRWCGLFLVAAGAAIFIWQQWSTGAG